MTVNDIITALKASSPHFPKKALHEARHCWDEMLPEIDRRMDNFIQKHPISESDKHVLFWLVLLLADRKETSRFPKLIEFFSESDEAGSRLECIFGDALTENLPNILYLTYNGNAECFFDIITSDQTGDWIKAACLRVISRLTIEGRLSKDTVLISTPNMMQSLELNRHCVAMEHFGRLLIHLQDNSQQPRFSSLIESGFFDDNFSECDLEELADWTLLWDMEEIKLTKTFDIMSLASWHCFRQNDVKDSLLAPSTATHIAPNKIGRNDPCRCGSGKKYKKCCLN